MSSTASWFCLPFQELFHWQLDGTHPLEIKIYYPNCFIGEKKKVKKSKIGLISILL